MPPSSAAGIKQRLPSSEPQFAPCEMGDDLPYHGSGEEAATFQTLPLHPTPPTGTSCQGLGSAGGASVRGRGLGRPGPMGTRGGRGPPPSSVQHANHPRSSIYLPGAPEVSDPSPPPAHPPSLQPPPPIPRPQPAPLGPRHHG